jgi:IS1 family transposase/lambda repressor-like predicted transcriptional regulator
MLEDVKMNKLSIEKRAMILTLLVEGSSMRSTSRIADVSINTVTKLLIDAGTVCAEYQNEHLVNIKSKRVQCDEIWSFCYAKEKNVAPADKGLLGYGDVYTWTAIDADTKLAISWLVGRRDYEYAEAFIGDLASRLNDRIQLTTDGYGCYINTVEQFFGGMVDYAMLVKIYGEEQKGDKRYSPASFVSAEKRVMAGNPDIDHVSTSYVERNNLTMRMGMRRFTRLTNGFSKKIENLAHAVALHFMHYNFVRIHKTLKTTPVMAAGISNTLWSMNDVVALIDAKEASKDRSRGKYKTKK